MNIPEEQKNLVLAFKNAMNNENNYSLNEKLESTSKDEHSESSSTAENSIPVAAAPKLDLFEINAELVSLYNENYIGMDESYFFGLENKLDIFEGKNNVIHVNISLYNLAVKIAKIKNCDLRYFFHMLIRIGVKHIMEITAFEIQEMLIQGEETVPVNILSSADMTRIIENQIKSYKLMGIRINKSVIYNTLINESMKRFY